MHTTYDELDKTLDLAKSLHKLTRDPLLPSAMSLLTPYLAAEDPDDVYLRPQATKAYQMVHLLESHRVALFP